jgi:hypothetical protein
MRLRTTRRVSVHTWLSLNAAAKVAGCSRATIRAAILRGDIKAYCDLCRARASVEELKEGHSCERGDSAHPDGHYRVLIRASDVKRYEIDETHRASGLASAKSKAKARTELIA